MQVGGGSGYKAEINVTPLVDVVLVLLIIFMVVTPMLQSGLAVELPEARNVTEKKSQREQVMITVAVAGQFFYEDQAVDKEGLLARVRDKLLYNPGIELLVKGDRRLDYSTVRDAMLALREAGAKSVVLATKERKDPGA